SQSIGDDDDPSSGATTPETKVIHIPTPTDGLYTLQVFGTGSGPFLIDFIGYDSNGIPSIITVTGNASLGSLASYQMNYSSVPGSQISVVSLNKCPKTKGFWKNNPDAWPVASLTLGTQSYSKTE